MKFKQFLLAIGMSPASQLLVVLALLTWPVVAACVLIYNGQVIAAATIFGLISYACFFGAACFAALATYKVITGFIRAVKENRARKARFERKSNV